jgi:hypothetical protein
VSLRIPDDLLETVRQRAEAEDRSLSAEIRKALRRDLDREGDNRAASQVSEKRWA